MIIGRLPRRLQLALGIGADPAAEPGGEPAPARDDFVAYAADCRIFGSVELVPGRLSDLLNAHDEYALTDVQLESLADGHVLSSPVSSSRATS